MHGSEHPPLVVDVDAEAMSPMEGGPIVSYADVLDQATPAVVAVYTSRIVSFQRPQALPELFRRFGAPVPRMPPSGAPRERREQLGVGSGVIISEDGYIVTNHHVVQGMRGREVSEIIVRLSDDSEYPAVLVGSDEKTDVAVLKIETEDALPALRLADSDLLRVGDVVFAIGNPLDVGLTATQGIVSATGRNQGGRVLGPGSYEDFIQTDAAINLGNSGGALIDARGRLIGINTAIVSGSGGNIGIGFAIPVNMVLNVARNLIERGEVPRGMLGLFPTDLNREMADAFGLDSTRGALVNQVQTDSPAARAGIVHGDIITRINETEIESAAQLRLVVSQILPGTEVDVTLVRRGSTKVVPVTLGSLGGGFVMGADGPLPGVELETLNDEIRDTLGVPDGLEGVAIRSISEDSTFYDKLEASMIILEVNGQQVTSVEDIADNLREGQNYLYVFADGNMGFVVFKM